MCIQCHWWFTGSTRRPRIEYTVSCIIFALLGLSFYTNFCPFLSASGSPLDCIKVGVLMTDGLWLYEMIYFIFRLHEELTVKGGWFTYAESHSKIKHIYSFKQLIAFRYPVIFFVRNEMHRYVASDSSRRLRRLRRKKLIGREQVYERTTRPPQNPSFWKHKYRPLNT